MVGIEESSCHQIKKHGVLRMGFMSMIKKLLAVSTSSPVTENTDGDIVAWFAFLIIYSKF